MFFFTQQVLSLTGITNGCVMGVFLLGMFVPRSNWKVMSSNVYINKSDNIFIFKNRFKIRSWWYVFNPLPLRIIPIHEQKKTKQKLFIISMKKVKKVIRIDSVQHSQFLQTCTNWERTIWEILLYLASHVCSPYPCLINQDQYLRNKNDRCHHPSGLCFTTILKHAHGCVMRGHKTYRL